MRDCGDGWRLAHLAHSLEEDFIPDAMEREREPVVNERRESGHESI